MSGQAFDVETIIVMAIRGPVRLNITPRPPGYEPVERYSTDLSTEIQDTPHHPSTVPRRGVVTTAPPQDTAQGRTESQRHACTPPLLELLRLESLARPSSRVAAATTSW
jgi:hypothetical protein